MDEFRIASYGLEQLFWTVLLLVGLSSAIFYRRIKALALIIGGFAMWGIGPLIVWAAYLLNIKFLSALIGIIGFIVGVASIIGGILMTIIGITEALGPKDSNHDAP